jgi:DNA-binding CsgD family transcriptional regulator
MEHGAPLKQGNTVDLTRLNAAEIRVLDLLADRHTAKSIASLTGCSVASVNERLRHSRRKTGVPSSRELARLLRAQENRTEKIGLADKATREQTSKRVRTGGIIMTALLLSAGIAALAAQISTDAPNTVRDPLIDGILGPPESGAHHFAQLVRREQRDAQWAGPLEAILKKRYSALVADGRIQLVRIRCARTVCEVVGKIDERDRDISAATVQRVQDHDFTAVKGMTHVGAAFGQNGYASWWKRN